MTVPRRNPSTDPAWSPCPPPLVTSSRWCKEWDWWRTGEESREKKTREKDEGVLGIQSRRELMRALPIAFVLLLGLLFRYIIWRLSMQEIEKVYKDGTNYGFTLVPFQCGWQQCYSTKGVQFSLYWFTDPAKLRNAEKMFLWGDIERFFLPNSLMLAFVFKLINISF